MREFVALAFLIGDQHRLATGFGEPRKVAHFAGSSSHSNTEN
jgi:hypothetical protein